VFRQIITEFEEGPPIASLAEIVALLPKLDDEDEQESAGDDD
jgi:hypothetical protein